MHSLSLAAAALLCVYHPALAEMHHVKMLNGNETGGMVFEREHLVIMPGDTLKFLATHRPHNAATINNFIPEGAETFLGNMNEEIEVTLTVPGVYGIKGSPHYDMGMVMLIEVGESTVEEAIIRDDLPNGAQRRFREIIARASVTQ